MKLYKKLLLIFLSLMVIIVSSATVYIAGERQMDSFQTISYKSSPVKQPSSIKIGVIGDSWVYGKKLDKSIADELKSQGIEAEVVSVGHPGAKSRQIYRDLLSDSSNPYSSNILRGSFGCSAFANQLGD